MTAPRQCFMRWLTFIAVGAIGICLQLSVLALLRSGFFGLNYFLANVISIAACSLLNFAVGDQFVFAPGGADR